MAERRKRNRAAFDERQYHRDVADQLIKQIRRGTAPWTTTWEAGGRELPFNLRTGRPYRGGNSVWLAATAERKGFSDPRWGTFVQVQASGARVRPGEKGTAIIYWQWEDRIAIKDERGRPLRGEDGEKIYETRPRTVPATRRSTVFNAEQCDGLPERTPRPAAIPWKPHEAVERMLRQGAVRLEHAAGNRAYYDLPRDRIVLPHRERFPGASAYYHTVLHECGHWTGHPDRLNRATLMKGVEEGFHSVSYAREELRAEICSMMTGDRLGTGHDPGRTAAYVKAWIKALKENPREIYDASRDAQLMSDYLIERVREREPERQPAGPTKPEPQPAKTPDGGEQLGFAFRRWPDRERAYGSALAAGDGELADAIARGPNVSVEAVRTQLSDRARTNAHPALPADGYSR